MSLITIKFLIFLIILFILYYIIPKKYQWTLLLAGSLFFYMCASPKYLIFLFLSSVSTYVLARCIKPVVGADDASANGLAKNADSIKNRNRLYMAIAVIINVGILTVLKYTGFVLEIIGAIFKKQLLFNIDFILPLGISFYTFMVVSYIVDVYKGEIEAEPNFFKYLLYVCYFPQIIEGPINRYSKIKDTLYAEHNFDFNACKNAGYRILLGLFKKVVIAGRFGIYVDRVFDNVTACNGITLFFATIFYVIQLYADFSGCMDMVLGISGLFGVRMSENFNLPLFSKTVSEFWRRWHITLGTWFKDYIYYPVFRSEFSKKLKTALSRAGIKKNAMNIVASFSLLCVWLLTGLWHGADMHYVLWGGYYSVILIGSLLLTNSFKKLKKKIPLNYDSKGFHLFQIIRTLFIFTLGELIFRANTCADAVYVMKKIVTDFSLSASSIASAIVPFTEDNTAVSYGAVAFVSAAIMFISEILEYNKCDILKKHKYIKAAFLIVVTLLFGVFGESGFLYMAY